MLGKTTLSDSAGYLNTNMYAINSFIFNLTFCTQYNFINSIIFYGVFGVVVSSLSHNSDKLIREKCTAT